MICTSMVNTQTDRFQLVIYNKPSASELKAIIEGSSSTEKSADRYLRLSLCDV